MEDRDAVAEARPHAADRLRRERDLGHEQDRAEPALEHGGADLEVDLGLAGAGRAVEQERPALTAVESSDDPLDRGRLLGKQLGGLVLAGERLALGRRRLLLAALRQLRSDEREGARPGSSRSSRRARARDRRAPGAPARRRDRSGPARSPRAGDPRARPRSHAPAAARTASSRSPPCRHPPRPRR